MTLQLTRLVTWSTADKICDLVPTSFVTWSGKIVTWSTANKICDLVYS